jgi:[ribosomal protein S5]-alanine N-acetyltransferase
MKNIQPIALYTKRLLLRAYLHGDETLLFQHYFGQLDVSKYLQRAPHKNIAQTQHSLMLWAHHKWHNTDNEFMWIIADRKTQHPMGILIFMQHGDVGEIHYGLGQAFQGQGLMLEALLAAVQFLKYSGQLSKIETFCAKTHLSSRHVLEKAGFKHIQDLARYAIFPNLNAEPQDCVEYCLNFVSTT